MKTSKLAAAVSDALPKRPKLRTISISDIHLGHAKTPSSYIIDNLDRDFAPGARWEDVDIVFFVGDIFDRALTAYDPQLFLVTAWMRRFLRMAKHYGIIVRALEGTPLHEWGQSRWMEEANEAAGANFKWVKTLSIEHIEELGIDVLYVPDEWKPDPDDVWKDVVRVLADAGLEQVDYTLFHATFDHQLPDINIPKHMGQRYQDITRRYVFSGHIHQKSRRGNILCNGSYDRIAHGEEGPKGYWDVTWNNGDDQIVFVENKGAKIYKTFDCSDMSMDQILEHLKAAADLPMDSHARIKAKAGDPILASMREIKSLYPHVFWSEKTMESKDVQKTMMVDKRSEFRQTQLTEQNLPELLMARIRAKVSDPVLLKRCAELLAENC